MKEKGGKPDRKPYPLPYGFRNPYRKRSLRILKMMSRNLITFVLLPENFHTYFELSAQAWTLFKAP